MTEKRRVLHPLKIRYHGTVSEMPYDERYTEFIQHTGLLPFITLVSRGRGANMNAAALTALVDRWRPEMHTFHLRAGEMTPTLQDVSMIIGLPIQGEPLCMNTTSDGWRGQMENLIGMAPPAPEDPKDRTPAGTPFLWIRNNFGTCPHGANEDTVRTYTRVYLWYMILRTFFADSGGKLAHWCWLKALTVLEHPWSWGTMPLAYLYRQLDEACRRTGSGGIGGCLLLLSIWSWDRLSVGRPRILNERPWPHYRNNPDREPTWAYLWDNVSGMTSDPLCIICLSQRFEIQKTATECEVVWDQSHRDEKPIRPMQHFIKNTGRKLRRLANLLGCREGEIAATSSSEEVEIPDDTILSQSITRGKKQATRSAYQLKPRGKAPNRYTPGDYVNRGKKVVIESDEEPAQRSALRRMTNDEPSSSEEDEQEVQQQEEQRQRTKRMAVRKQPVRRGRRA
ncbi:hypothetical protein QYE76_023425 [Lolium multiflorum]|uniref:Aminotransferase-like plant mobile domain-containing protein n=1 Tax=Lolium multiflorum TaxID=4521 RepID=A0AAD8REP4_LOLMU|nr:hypothetical protein QYE76_023425 [Lolium multiflorum]